MATCNPTSLLKATNTKQTETRDRILKKILNSARPITANDLHKSVSAKSSVDLATVYRTLKVFSEKGLIRQLHIDGDTIYYEKACEHNPLHAHFYCDECREVECLNPFGFSESASFINMAKGKNIRSVELVIKGRCEKCANQF